MGKGGFVGKRLWVLKYRKQAQLESSITKVWVLKAVHQSSPK